DRRGHGLSAALPEQELGAAPLGQLAGAAAGAARPQPEPGEQPDRLPGPGLHPVPGLAADRRVLRRRPARRLPLRTVPAAGAVPRCAAAPLAAAATAGRTRLDMAAGFAA